MLWKIKLGNLGESWSEFLTAPSCHSKCITAKMHIKCTHGLGRIFALKIFKT